MHVKLPLISRLSPAVQALLTGLCFQIESVCEVPKYQKVLNITSLNKEIFEAVSSNIGLNYKFINKLVINK